MFEESVRKSWGAPSANKAAAPVKAAAPAKAAAPTKTAVSSGSLADAVEA